jgi:hypothetical protein
MCTCLGQSYFSVAVALAGVSTLVEAGLMMVEKVLDKSLFEVEHLEGEEVVVGQQLVRHAQQHV